MVHKFMYQLVSNIRNDESQMPIMNQSIMLNNHLHDFLKNHKDCIGEHYKNKKWDKFKKFANDYELIYTSSGNFPSIAEYPAISRSFFKLWEILTDFDHVIRYKDKVNVRAGFLAEGPGGFLEAFARYRPREYQKYDEMFGITLISPDKNIPNWKIPNDINGNIRLLYGADGTGSLYNTENIAHFESTIGANSLDLVTADGGFDFSNDFNSQEELSMQLIICEIYTALRLQAKNGTFVLKIYDMKTQYTMRLIWVLKKHYSHIHFVKPLSSRPANSEKYIVAIGFVGGDMLDMKIMNALEKYVQTQNLKAITESIPLPCQIVHEIVNYNVFYIAKQVINIHKTLAFIANMKYDRFSESFNENLKEQIRKSIKWCFKYNLPISFNSLRFYRKTYKL